MSTVIKVENLSKQYRLGLVGASTFREDTQRWWAKLKGKEDPFLKLGVENDRTLRDESKFVWSLKDIDFKVNQGDVLGIIGRNGAGKSTLLKILSKVTAPTTGSVKVKGRIASLLEVGTGFHPELTGRENIYLNGAILGMRKHEITRKLDEIIAFAGVEKYVDTPVKRYSSGMYVRLAFAVAAHLESEILIVDEVLAVGDADFQKKCLGKMGEISKGDGRTILFVSHNLSAMRNLCSRAILLTNGKLSLDDNISKVVESFQIGAINNKLTNEYYRKTISESPVQLTKLIVRDHNMSSKSIFDICEEIILDVEIICSKKINGAYAYLTVSNKEDIVIIETDSKDILPNLFEDLEIGLNKFSVTIKNNILPIGEHKLYFSIASMFYDGFTIDCPGTIVVIQVVDNSTERANNRLSLTSHILKWEKSYV